MAVLIEPKRFRTAPLRYIDMGGSLRSPWGAAQRLNRMGNHFAQDVELPPLGEGRDGRLMIAALEEALTDGALFPIPQFGFDVGAPGSPLVDGAVTGGSVLPVKAGTPSYAFRRGQVISIIHGGQRYVHKVKAQTVLDATGAGDVPIYPMLREELSDGDVIEVSKPMIEGFVEMFEPGQMLEPYVTIRFTIEESK